MSSLDDPGLDRRIAVLRERVGQACRASGRQPDAVKIMAVTKGHPRVMVDKLVHRGFTLFGENRVQEAHAKYSHLGGPISLHLIGHLQTNKVKLALEIFQVIQTVDSPRVLEAIDRRGSDSKSYPVMVEVNAGREPQKHGLHPDQVWSLVERVRDYRHVRVVGLMAVLPMRGPAMDTERLSGMMRETREVFDRIRDQHWPWAPLEDLSMGMSGDFEEAIVNGSTMVRVGTVLLGPREPAEAGTGE